MLPRMLNLREGEGRVVLLLGSFSFFLLAATTIQGAAADSLFLNYLGAEQLPYAIALAQVMTILGFYLYRGLRQLLRTAWLTPAVVVLLMTGLVVGYSFAAARSSAAAYVIYAMVPLYASVLASESGRLSASLLDVRSARRLLPLLGAIGGAGAAAGGLVVSIAAPRVGQAGLLLLAAGTLAFVVLPASRIRESMRPRVSARLATAKEVIANRYAVALMLAAALVIVLSTLVKYQFNAAVGERYSGDDVAVFMGQFMLVLNIASIVFAQIAGRVLIERLGAARSLVTYPLALTMIAAVGAFIPGLASAASAQFGERLFRQNIHNTVANLVGMPLATGIRVRMALIVTGTLKPLAVLLSSGALLLTVGAWAPPGWELDWRDLYWPIAAVAAALLAALYFVRLGYAQRLQSALHARRLQLDGSLAVNPDEDVHWMQPSMDAQLRLTLHGYLASDLEERNALALRLLRGAANLETLGVMRRQWPLWAPWLRELALAVAAEMTMPEATQWLETLKDEPDDAVRAALLGNIALSFDAQALTAEIAAAQERPRSAAAALLRLAGSAADSDAAADALGQWIEDAQAQPQLAQAAARALAQWPDNRFDARLPELAVAAPAQTLGVILRRPEPEYSSLCVPLLADDALFPSARQALLAIGLPAVSPLEQAAEDPRQSDASFRVLPSIAGEPAHLAGLRLMAHQDARVRQQATLARIQGDFELSAAERTLLQQNLERSLSAAQHLHAYQQQLADGLLAQLARNERTAALEHLFLSLTLLYPQAPIRQAQLALLSADVRQRSFALELLDEALPRSIKSPLFPVLEDQPVKADQDPEANPDWLMIKHRLDSLGASETQLRALAASTVFARWQLDDLELLLSDMSSSSAAPDQPQVVVRDGTAIELERLLLRGESPPVLPGDLCIPLAAVYRVIRQSPRCGLLWLESLAERVPEPEQGSIEVTRSAMVSLASRTQADDEREADAIDLWQRMFFLRSNPLTESLPAPRLRLIAEISRTLQAPAGTVVVHENRLGNHFYMVCSGRLEVSQGDRRLAQLAAGESFGALALIRGQRRLATVRALEDSELLAISRTDFLDLLAVHPGLVRSLARAIAAQVLTANPPRSESA
ncbi:MAG: cyclic nucleotide-binding domain-containing protein [Pseudomonadota bacterium]